MLHHLKVKNAATTAICNNKHFERRRWLGIRMSIRPVKNLSDVVLAWLSV